MERPDGHSVRPSALTPPMYAAAHHRRDVEQAAVRAELIVGAGAILAFGLRLVLAKMLTAMLTHVFDPPPDYLTIPWGYLTLLAGSAVIAAAIATMVCLRTLQRLLLGTVLRDAS